MKTKHRKRTPRIFLSALLTLVLAISIAAPLQALAAGDDVFYMSVSGTLRYDYANEVASLTNQQRAANGQAALQLDPVLTERAMLRAREISRIFEHTRPNGQDCSSVLDGTQFEFGGTGENIAMGTAWFFSPSIAMESWMNSSGHRANILGSSYQSLGVGVAVDSATGMACYVQLFSTLPASGGSVSNGTVEYNSFVEGSDNCPYYNEIMGPTYLYYMSPVFDADYYMEANPDTDVLTGGYDAGAAFTHFLDYGMAEGRRGNEEFDVNSYRNQYGDLRAAYGDDLISYYLHYIDYGRSEGRQGSGYTGPAVPSDPGTPSTPGGSRLTVYELSLIHIFGKQHGNHSPIQSVRKSGRREALGRPACIIYVLIEAVNRLFSFFRFFTLPAHLLRQDLPGVLGGRGGRENAACKKRDMPNSALRRGGNQRKSLQLQGHVPGNQRFS